MTEFNIGAQAVRLNSLGYRSKRVVSQARAGEAGQLIAQLVSDVCPRTYSMLAGSVISGQFRTIRAASSAGSMLTMFADSTTSPIGENPVSTGINVVDEFNADNTGATNTTAQLTSAYNGSSAGDTLFFPPGTYLIDPDTLVMSARNIVGYGATLKAAGAGTRLWGVAPLQNVFGLNFDGNNASGVGLLVDSAHGSVIRDCTAEKCTVFGMRFVDVTLTGCYNIAAKDSQKGIQLLGCNGSPFFGVKATNCVEQGLDVVGVYSGETAQAGSGSIYGILLDLNGSDGISPQMTVRGLAEAHISGAYIEGAQDGIWVGEGTRQTVFQNLRFVGGDPSHAFVLNQAYGCTFIGNGAPADLYSDFYCPEPASIGSNWFYGNMRSSNVVDEPMDVVLYDAGGPTTYKVTPRDFGLTGDAAPTLGRWRAGQRIWSKTGGGGWRCTVNGTPGTWVAF